MVYASPLTTQARQRAIRGLRWASHPIVGAGVCVLNWGEFDLRTSCPFPLADIASARILCRQVCSSRFGRARAVHHRQISVLTTIVWLSLLCISLGMLSQSISGRRSTPPSISGVIGLGFCLGTAIVFLQRVWRGTYVVLFFLLFLGILLAAVWSVALP